MGGCVSSPKESDMNEVESLHDKPLSETAVAKENNGEDQKEVAPTELPEETAATETTSNEAAAELAVAATSEKVDEAIAVPSEKVEVAATEANASEKTEVDAPENVMATSEHVVKEKESTKEESKEPLVTV